MRARTHEPEVATDSGVPTAGNGRPRRRLSDRWATALLVGGSVLLALACSRHGAAIGGDGVGYVMAARNLLAGQGLSWVGAAGDIRPMTIFGPLFPILLSGAGLAGIEAQTAARWLNALLFGTNVFLILAVLRLSLRAPWMPWLGGLMLAFFPPILGLHAGVQSEPVFITLLLLEILALTRALRSDSRAWLLAAGAASGFAYLARYAGLAFIASGFLAVLMQPKATWRLRLGRAALFALVACLPVVAWMTRNGLVGGTATARLIDIELPAASLAYLLADLVSYWFLPDRLSVFYRAGAVALGGILLAAAWWSTRRSAAPGNPPVDSAEPSGILRRVTAWGLAVYAAQILVSRVFLVPRISLDQRILLPAWLLTLLFLFGIGWLGGKIAGKEERGWLPRIITWAYIAKLLGSFARFYMVTVLYETGDSLRYHEVGTGFANVWRGFVIPVSTAGNPGTGVTEVITAKRMQ